MAESDIHLTRWSDAYWCGPRAARAHDSVSLGAFIDLEQKARCGKCAAEFVRVIEGRAS
jgi:hypothetical protein